MLAKTPSPSDVLSIPSIQIAEDRFDHTRAILGEQHSSPSMNQSGERPYENPHSLPLSAMVLDHVGVVEEQPIETLGKHRPRNPIDDQVAVPPAVYTCVVLAPVVVAVESIRLQDPVPRPPRLDRADGEIAQRESPGRSDGSQIGSARIPSVNYGQVVGGEAIANRLPRDISAQCKRKGGGIEQSLSVRIRMSAGGCE